MTNLQELTGQESGIVIYGANGAPEAVVCNWSHIKGFPRVDPLGLTVLGFADLPEDVPEGHRSDDIPALLEGVHIVFANGEDMPQRGTVYEYDSENITIIAPDDWN